MLGLFFAAAGANHFVHPDFYVRTVPGWLPAHELLVQISGVAEIAGGAAMFVPPLRMYAGIWLLALLVAVFPANLQMALHPQLYRDIGSPMAFYLRLPLQAVMAAWVWWTCF